MKKLSLLLATLLALLMLFAPAQAESVPDLLKGLGLSDEDAQALAAVVGEMGPDVTEEQIRALLTEFIGKADAAKQPGTLADGVFTHPAGFSFRVPENWAVSEDQPGVAALLTGPKGEKDFSPTIAVVALPETQPDFETNTKEDWDAILSASLPNYQSVALDSFTFLDVPAHEFVCMHGTDEENMLMQYQMHFNKDGRAFVIMLTTLAEEAAQDAALDTYDRFLSEFTVTQAPGGIG